MSTNYKIADIADCRKYIKRNLPALSVVSKPYKVWERLLSYQHHTTLNFSLLESIMEATQMKIGDIEVTPNGVIKIWWWRKR